MHSISLKINTILLMQTRFLSINIYVFTTRIYLFLLQDFLIRAKLLWCGRVEEGGALKRSTTKKVSLEQCPIINYCFWQKKNKTIKTK